MKDTVGQRLARLRRERDINQVEVAEAVGVGRSFLSMLEGDRKEGSLATLVALADYYQVSLDYLTGRAPPPSGNPDDIAKDEDERFLLECWRDITDEDRAALRVALRNARIASHAA